MAVKRNWDNICCASGHTIEDAFGGSGETLAVHARGMCGRGVLSRGVWLRLLVFRREGGSGERNAGVIVGLGRRGWSAWRRLTSLSPGNVLESRWRWRGDGTLFQAQRQGVDLKRENSVGSRLCGFQMERSGRIPSSHYENS